MTNDELLGLVRRIGRGDSGAIEDFYRVMEKPLYRFIYSKLNDPFLSGDLVHDVFLDIWRGASGFQGASNVKTWVFAIAYRKVMDVFRRNRRMVGDSDIPEREDESPDAASCLIAAEESAILHHCLGTLKPEHRSAIELTFLEDMSYREVATVVGVPEGTVKTRVFHAKSLLLRCLSAQMKGKVAR